VQEGSREAHVSLAASPPQLGQAVLTVHDVQVSLLHGPIPRDDPCLPVPAENTVILTYSVVEAMVAEQRFAQMAAGPGGHQRFIESRDKHRSTPFLCAF